MSNYYTDDNGQVQRLAQYDYCVSLSAALEDDQLEDLIKWDMEQYGEYSETYRVTVEVDPDGSEYPICVTGLPPIVLP